MKKIAISFVLLFSALVSASEYKQTVLLENYDHVYDMAEHKGQTYLSFMREVIKPAMDELATDGYVVADGKTIEKVYRSVDKKVQGVVESNGGLANVKKIAEALAGKTVTLETLPAEIAKVDRSVNRYNLATFLGLASGGGVVVRFYENNYGYNVHYDTTEQKSGRSFGAGPTRLANDASDKAYLDDISEYSEEDSEENMPEFYEALLLSLLNTDSSEYKDVTPFGQTVLTDFLSVYTAEQARNLMDGSVHIHWDAALLEVTLLASFHAGQDEFKLFYQNPQTQEVTFTDSVYNQTPCAVPQKLRKASMRDYWQFSRRIDDEKNCKRSGINITNREFRKLGTKITTYMFENHPEVANRVKESMGLTGRTSNLYHELSKFLISDETPEKISAKKSKEMTAAWVDFLAQVTESAEKITSDIEKSE